MSERCSCGGKWLATMDIDTGDSLNRCDRCGRVVDILDWDDYEECDHCFCLYAGFSVSEGHDEAECCKCGLVSPRLCRPHRE